MAGTQALVALKSSGNLVVKTFNLISYGSIKEEKLSFDVWDLGVESLNGTTAIFASVKIPAGADKVNHIWQVGGTVTNGSPGKHEFNPPNLAAKQTLQLTGNAAPSPGSTSAPGGSPGSGNSTSGGYSYSRREMKFGVYAAGLLVIVCGFNIWL
ncbi:Auxin-induced in root cultures protein 12 [Linum perenne]